MSKNAATATPLTAEDRALIQRLVEYHGSRARAGVAIGLAPATIGVTLRTGKAGGRIRAALVRGAESLPAPEPRTQLALMATAEALARLEGKLDRLLTACGLALSGGA